MRNLFCFLFYSFLSICLFLFISCQHQPKSYILFPQTLSNLHLVKLIKGNVAINMVNRLHGKPIQVKKAWVAYYKDAHQNKAIIWVSEAFTSSQAKKQTEIMMEKILKGKSPFYNFQEKEISHTLIYFFSGLGKNHAVFYKNKLVFWITANHHTIDKIINYYLNL